MATTNYLDLSYEGRTLAERRQLDNGKLPHGGYRGMRKYPMSHLSHGKGREFREKIEEEISRVLEEEHIQLQGESPSWSLVVHREPSHSNQSPLIAQNFLSGSKFEQANGASLMNRTSLLPARSQRSAQGGGAMYYRPNRLHQYLTATELKDSNGDHVDVRYGRPTRATLLRARSRCPSAPTNSSYENQRELLQRLDTLKHAWTGSSSVEYLQLDSAREEESLHSYLTGARYNRAHCLDSKSVEHSGVYMPRTNTAMACFFTGPKGQQYLQEFVETPRSLRPITPRTPSSRRRPLTAPSSRRRSSPVAPPSAGSEVKGGRRVHPRSAEVAKSKQAKLNVIGKCLPIDIVKVTGVKMTNGQRQEVPRTPKSGVDDVYSIRQPPPTPTTATGLEVFGEPLSVGERGRGRKDSNGAAVAVEENVEEKEKENGEDEMARGQLVEGEETCSPALVSVPFVAAETHSGDLKLVEKDVSQEVTKDIVKEPLVDEDAGLEEYKAKEEKDSSPKEEEEREHIGREKEEEEAAVSEAAEVVVKETLIKAERETVACDDVRHEDSTGTDLSQTREDASDRGKQCEASSEGGANEQTELVEEEIAPDENETELAEEETEVVEEGERGGEDAEVAEEQQSNDGAMAYIPEDGAENKEIAPEIVTMNNERTMEDEAHGNNTEKSEEDHAGSGKTSDKEVRFFITENDEHTRGEKEATEYEESEVVTENV